MGAGETAIETLLSTNPDPDYVTHAHAGAPPADGAEEGTSPSPSIDSDKENDVEMVNLLHPHSPGQGKSSGLLKPSASGDGILGNQQEQDEDEELLTDVQKPPVKVCFRFKEVWGFNSVFVDLVCL